MTTKSLITYHCIIIVYFISFLLICLNSTPRAYCVADGNDLSRVRHEKPIFNLISEAVTLRGTWVVFFLIVWLMKAQLCQRVLLKQWQKCYQE